MRRAQSHVLLTQPFSALVESTLIYQHSGLTVYLRWKQARIDALAEQLPHDRVLAHQPRGVRGRGGRRWRQRRPPERSHVRPELPERLGYILLVQQQSHHLDT